jgi:hypothetical protein
MSYGRRLLEETASESLSATQHSLLLEICDRDPTFRRDLEWLLAQFRGDLGPHLIFAVAEELGREPQPDPEDALSAALSYAVSVPMLELGDLLAGESQPEGAGEGREHR